MITSLEAKRIFQMLYYLRYAEEGIAREYAHGYMKCPVHLYSGQEAIAAGVCLHLSQHDYAVTNHRSHGHYLAKGGDLKKLLAELSGLPSGCSKGWGGSMHLYAPEVGILGTSSIVGGGIAVGTGIAWALKMKQSQHLCAVFFGDGATEEGYFYESLNFAALKKLPALYICENNSLATHSRIEKRRPAGIELYKIAESLGIESGKIDGNDAAAVYERISRAAGHVREKKEPFFLEATTYRWKGHVSPKEDCAEGYRSEKELSEWKKCCPVERFITYARQHSLLQEIEIQAIKDAVAHTVEQAFQEIKDTLGHQTSDTVAKTPF